MWGLAFYNVTDYSVLYNNAACPVICEGWHFIVFFIITLLSRLYVRVGILLTCGKHLHDRIISLKGDAWDHNTSLSPPFSIEVSVSCQESMRSFIGVVRISILPFSMIVLCDVRTFRQCDILCFSFYSYAFCRLIYNLLIPPFSTSWILYMTKIQLKERCKCNWK